MPTICRPIQPEQRKTFDPPDPLRIRHNHRLEPLRQAPMTALVGGFCGIPCLCPPRLELPPDANEHGNRHSDQSSQRQCQNRKKNLDDHRVLAYQSRGNPSEYPRACRLFPQPWPEGSLTESAYSGFWVCSPTHWRQRFSISRRFSGVRFWATLSSSGQLSPPKLEAPRLIQK